MKTLINFAAFQLGWFASVLGAASGKPWLGPLAVAIVIALHLHLSDKSGPEIRLIGFALSLGLVVDSLILATGWVNYDCLPCSQEIGGDYEVSVTTENLAKPGSLKKNYGGLRLKKRRRRIEPKDE